jgi:hypothetical protein
MGPVNAPPGGQCPPRDQCLRGASPTGAVSDRAPLGALSIASPSVRLSLSGIIPQWGCPAVRLHSMREVSSTSRRKTIQTCLRERRDAELQSRLRRFKNGRPGEVKRRKAANSQRGGFSSGTFQVQRKRETASSISADLNTVGRKRKSGGHLLRLPGADNAGTQDLRADVLELIAFNSLSRLSSAAFLLFSCLFDPPFGPLEKRARSDI